MIATSQTKIRKNKSLMSVTIPLEMSTVFENGSGAVLRVLLDEPKYQLDKN